MPLFPFDWHLDVSVEVGREGSEALAGAVSSHLARHPPASTQGRASGEEVTPRQESQPSTLLSPDCRLQEEQEEDEGEEGVAATHRLHPDSDLLTQKAASLLSSSSSPRDGPPATTGESPWH